jgi:hypothetical protein
LATRSTLNQADREKGLCITKRQNAACPLQERRSVGFSLYFLVY